MLTKSDKSYILSNIIEEKIDLRNERHKAEIELQKEIDWIKEVIGLLLDREGLEINKVYTHLELRKNKNGTTGKREG